MIFSHFGGMTNGNTDIAVEVFDEFRGMALGSVEAALRSSANDHTPNSSNQQQQAYDQAQQIIAELGGPFAYVCMSLIHMCLLLTFAAVPEVLSPACGRSVAVSAITRTRASDCGSMRSHAASRRMIRIFLSVSRLEIALYKQHIDRRETQWKRYQH